MKVLDLTGKRFGRLTAVKRAPNVGRRTQWVFDCDCGNRTIKRTEPVRSGVTTSCGCVRVEVTAGRSRTHGHSSNGRETKTLKSYRHAKSRCTNPNDPKFPLYGGRGIKMCDRWIESFEAFLFDMGECPNGRTLDRIDVNKGYDPQNCEWATPKQQARHRTDNVLVSVGDRTLVLKDYAALRGVNYKTLHARVKYRRMTPKDAADAILSSRKT